MSDKGLTAATYVAASGGLIFGLSAAEFAAYASVCLGLLTFLTNVAFKIYDRRHMIVVNDDGPFEDRRRSCTPVVIDRRRRDASGE